MPRIRAESIEAHKSATRNELLEAASALFRAQGYGDTNLADVTAYAGIGRTTIYEYFLDKEDLLVNLIEAAMPAAISEILAGLPEGLTVRERLSELIIRSLEFVSTDHHLGSMMMKELPVLTPQAARRVRAVHAPLETEIVRLCAMGIDSGEFRQFEPTDAGRLVFGVVMATSQTLLRDRDAKQRLHEAADAMVRLVFDGLST